MARLARDGKSQARSKLLNHFSLPLNYDKPGIWKDGAHQYLHAPFYHVNVKTDRILVMQVDRHTTEGDHS
jgi:hypothetical protein